MGRKVTVFTKKFLNELIEKMNQYTEETDIPILAEFAYKNNIIRQELYKHPELSFAIKKMMDKKEAQLEKKGLKGEVNSTMAVFSLKQLGWKDKQEVEHSNKEDKSLKIEFV